MLCGALMQNNGRLEADRNDQVAARDHGSSATRSATRSASRPPTSPRLSKAFFAELESKYLRA